MMKIVSDILALLLIVAGVGLLYLTNNGILSFAKPYLLQKSSALTAPNRPVAFINVNVIPMDTERLLTEQTVIVRDGIIDQIGSRNEVDIPQDALVIQAAGQYLMPGLVDMHVHIKEENELLLFVAHGVTTVRDMWGTTGLQLGMGFPDQLTMRAQIKTGHLFGPTLYTAGPIMEGEPPTSPLMPVIKTPVEAREAVAWQKSQGYDFIKVYDNLTTETYKAILQAAADQGLAVAGHAPKQVGLTGVLDGGQQTIEHLTGYIDPDAAVFLIPVDQLDRYAALTREAGVWNCPTLGVYKKHVPDEALVALESRPEMAYVSPRMKFLWKRVLRPGAMQNISYQGDYPARISEINTRMAQALHNNGARIILGTDADNPYQVPGTSLLDELDYLIEAGFSPYEALEAGTHNAAETLGKLDEFGTISRGKRADLILLAGNPLEDMTHIRRREGVMLRGQWLSEAQLRQLLADLVASYTPSLIERLWPVSLIALGAAGLLGRLGLSGRRNARVAVL